MQRKASTPANGLGIAFVLWVAAPAIAQDPKPDTPAPAVLRERAKGFFGALGAGDAAKVLSFQPTARREGMSEEERTAFATAVKGARTFLDTAAGKFQREAFERVPAVEGLPADARGLDATWELELRTGEGAATLLHGVRLRLAVEREEGAGGKAAWPISEFEAELESVQPASGIVDPQLDLAPVGLTGVLGELMFGVGEAEIAERGSKAIALEALKLERLAEDPASAAGPLVERVRSAVAQKDGAALLASVHLDEGAEPPDAKSLVEALSGFAGLDERLRTWIRPGALPASAMRASVQVVTPKGTQLVAWSKRNGKWALDDLSWEPADEKSGAPFHLRELLGG